MLTRNWIRGLVLALVVLVGCQLTQAQTFSVLYSFTGAGGAVPEANLTLIGLNLYGTTSYGGAFSAGTVFKLTSTGIESVLHSFAGGPSDGYGPGSGLIYVKNNFYGTTFYGGANGSGIVFKLNPKTGSETNLHNFAGGPSDGSGPQNQGALVMDASGDLYGTTTGGGFLGCNVNGFYGCGAVFKLTGTSSETLLYRFCSQTNCVDGQNPIAGLVTDSTGNLYGTTFYGGTYGYGTVFKLNPATGQETMLYSFIGGSDGEGPVGSLIMINGNLYGTALHGGSPGPGCDSNGYVGCGTVFELTTTGQEKVLYRFCSQTNCTDGANPAAGLIKDAKGNFYSTTYNGGAFGVGTVFRLNSTGKETVLHSFCSAINCTDGTNPHGSLVRDKVGNLYGTTMHGGGSGCGDCGTVFKLAP